MNNPVKANVALASKLNKWAWVASALVFLLVVSMRRIKIPTDIDFTFLPPLYSGTNALVAVILICGLIFIKKGRVEQHRKAMTVAMLLSAIFLVMYVIYHVTTPETKYCGIGLIRNLYFFLLISHIILAAVILPFILFTYIRAYTNQFEKHVKLAKWVFPLWLYVAATGPILYLMLRPCY